MADLPALANPLDPAFQIQPWLQPTKRNVDPVIGAIGPLPEDETDIATAETINGALQAIKAFADYVQGLTPITALQIAEYFRLPRYTTAQLTDPLAVEQGEGAIAYNTTTGGIVTSNGTTWVAAGGIASLGDASALSVLGRAENSVGDYADIVADTDGHVLRRSGTSLGFGQLDTTQISRTFADIDLTALATLALTDGDFPIGPLTFTAALSSRAGAGSGIVNGSGLRFTSPTSQANTWTAASQNAPYLYLASSSIPGFRPGEDTIAIDMHLGNQIYENGNDCVRMGLWALADTPFTGAAARARIADKGNHGGTSTLRTFDGSTAGSTAVDLSAFDSYSVIIPPAGDMILGVGNYSGGWPSFAYFWRFSTTLATSSVLAAGTRLLITFINASDASPTSTVDIAHLRLRKVD